MFDSFSTDENYLQNSDKEDTKNDISSDDDISENEGQSGSNFNSQTDETTATPSRTDTSDSDSCTELSEREVLARNKQIELQERFLALQSTINELRIQLKQETELWKKEAEEVNQLAKSRMMNFDTYQHTETNEFYDGYDKFGVLSRSHAEKCANIQRQMAITNYKRRLLEVENMCNLELLRVKQSVQFLQPLQMMAMKWNVDMQGGDAQMVLKPDDGSQSDDGRLSQLTQITELSDKGANIRNSESSELRLNSSSTSSLAWNNIEVFRSSSFSSDCLN